MNPDENRAEGYADYIPLRESDPLLRHDDLVKRLVVLNDAGEPHMRLQNDRCMGLRGTIGRRAVCTVYELRPAACRKLEAGSERCLQYRLERGIDKRVTSSR
jgi:Fe-S-cluster containining protein